MDKKTLDSLLPAIVAAARRAGEAIQHVAAGRVDVETKGDGSPLTQADLASHRTIVAALEALPQNWPVLSEEGDVSAATEGPWQTYWCVDPLDGTKEFVKGLDEYTVNIALIENAEPILGVIYVPAQDVMYWAARGCGAHKACGPNAPQPIHPTAELAPTSAVVSRSHLDSDTETFLKSLGVEDVVQHGSSIKICAVADGTADIYPRFGPTCLWDTAAGAAIALEAGCDVVDLTGAPLRYAPAEGVKQSGFLVYPSTMAIPAPR